MARRPEPLADVRWGECWVCSLFWLGEHVAMAMSAPAISCELIINDLMCLSIASQLCPEELSYFCRNARVDTLNWQRRRISQFPLHFYLKFLSPFSLKWPGNKGWSSHPVPLHQNHCSQNCIADVRQEGEQSEEKHRWSQENKGEKMKGKRGEGALNGVDTDESRDSLMLL